MYIEPDLDRAYSEAPPIPTITVALNTLSIHMDVLSEAFQTLEKKCNPVCPDTMPAPKDSHAHPQRLGDSPIAHDIVEKIERIQTLTNRIHALAFSIEL